LDRWVAPTFRVFPDLEGAATALAGEIVESAGRAIAARGSCSMVLPGGSSPAPLYRELSGRRRRQVRWDRVDLFWGDERAVPPYSPESNYGLAARNLLPLPGLPESQVHRMKGEADPLELEARRYERELTRVVADSGGNAGDRPFDLLLLGMGPDGHTASLFPGSPRLAETRRQVVVEPRPSRPPFVPRLTLTLPVLNGSREVFFLVAGSDKAPVVRRILGGPSVDDPPPAGWVHGLERTTWFLDQAAASGLPIRRS
jgi:6-phosphogluconolactonase